MTSPEPTKLTHVGIHESLNRNAGDTLLFDEVRRLFGAQLGSIDWDRRQVWESLDLDTVGAVNDAQRPLVIGGGGLLLRDQAGADASASGWQWNSRPDAVRALEVPVVVFAIGYNRFRGQEDFDAPFTDHMNALAERSTFFGLRNNGSIRAVKSYLAPELQDKLSLQPCPTVSGWQLHEDVAETAAAHSASGHMVLRANVAFDRPQFRFGTDPDAVLGRLAEALAHAQQTGWEIRFTAHKEMDLQFLPYLEAANVGYQVDDITDADPAGILDTYARCDLAVGLRGHAQMVPFGLRRPIVSVISHDKMGWFLDDIEHPEWGVEIAHASLRDDLCDRIDTQRIHRDRIARELAVAQQRQWEIGVRNLEYIGSALTKTGASC